MRKFILLILSLSVCILLSFYMRGKVNSLSFDKILNTTINIDLSHTFDAFSETHPRSLYVDDYENINNYEELFNKTDVIAKIKVLKRRQRFNIVETIVEVIDLYKGDCHQKITLYEPICFDGDGDCFAYSSIPLLHNNEEYIVFLKESLPKDKNYYNYVNTCLGAYPIKDNLNITTFKVIEGNYFKFEKTLDCDIIKLDYSSYPKELQNKDFVDTYYKHINMYSEFHSFIIKKFK